MTRNENQLTGLPFYTAEQYQDRNKWWVQNIYRLLSPDLRFLPFQIIKDITEIGGVTCPVPESITYTSDFSTTTDDWFGEIFLGDISLNIVRDGLSLRIDVTNNTPGSPYGFNMKRVITATKYRFNNGSIETTVNGSSADCQLAAYSVPGFEGLLPSGTSIDGGYYLNEAGSGDDYRDFVSLSFYNVNGSDASFYISFLDSQSNPYQLLNENTPYQSDFSSSVDGWAIISSGSAVLSSVPPDMRLTYNSDISSSIDRALSYSNENIIEWSINIEAGIGVLDSIRIYATRNNGQSLVRTISGINHTFHNDTYTYTTENFDDIKTFDRIELLLLSEGAAYTQFVDINIQTLEECVESQAEIWTDAQLINAKTEASTDITDYMNANTEVITFADYQVVIYDASVNLGAAVAAGEYYIFLNDGTSVFYSEVFLTCADLSDYVKVEWWRDSDLIFDTGRIVYSTGFINTMYLDTDIGKPGYEFEIKETVRNGYKFVEKVTSYKRFKFDNEVPEAIADVLSRIPNHEYVIITNQGIDYRVTKIDILEIDWDEVGDLGTLPIEFETNTVISSGTNVSGAVNELLGDETDAINIRGNSKRIFQLNDALTYDDLFVAADRSTNTEAVRIPLAFFTELATLEVLPVSTSVYYGGEISINIDPAKFDIEAGRAVFVDNYTDPSAPAVVFTEWSKQIGVTVDNIATQLVTFVTVNSSGAFIQSNIANTNSDNRDTVELGVLVHENLTSVSQAKSLANWNKDVDLKVLDMSGALGRINVNGNVYTYNGANLRIDKSAGEIFAINSNYDNKETPNNTISEAETAITFLTARGGTPSGIGQSQDIDTVNYDPLGAGVLTPIPTDAVTSHGIFFSPETGLTIVHYGQFLYDTLKEAIDGWEKATYTVIPELGGVPLRGVLAFVAGATNLSDPTQAKFIDLGQFGFRDSTRTEEYSRYESLGRSLAGMSYKRPDIEILEDTGVIYADVERLGGGDMVFVFGEREYVLNCTTGGGSPGTGGGTKARVALTAGTASTPLQNWVYATPTAGNGHAQLNSSTSYPTGEIAFILDLSVPDVATFLTEGSFAPRRWTDAKEFDGRSSIARTNEWIRRQPSTWISGVLQTVTIDTVPSPDSVIFSNTAGVVLQKHDQTFPALSIEVSGIYIANHPTHPITSPIYDLNDSLALVTSDGTSMADTRFNWVIWGDISKTTGECKLYVNLPIDTYSIDQNAVDDPNNTAVTSIPTGFEGKAFLIARMPMRHRSPGGGTYENLALAIRGTEVIDLRGEVANAAGGATSPPLTNSFEDALFNIYNVLNGFNFRFDAVNLTADRIFTAPDSAGTLALLELAQAFTALQEFEKGITVDPNDTYLPANGIAFGSNSDGFYLTASGRIVLRLGGQDRWEFHSDTFRSVANVGAELARLSPGELNVTIRAYAGDNDTGLSSPDFDIMGLVVGGVLAARLEPGVQKFYGQAVGGDNVEGFTSTPEFDFDDGNTHEIVLTGNITSWTIANELPAGSYTIWFIQDGTGGRTIADPTGIDYEGDQSIADFITTADDINIVNVIVSSSGVTVWSLVQTITI